jgi:hypothetical protein
MAGEPVRQFDAASTQRIADAVRKVERMPTIRPGVAGSRPSPQARELRWARTTTSYEYPTYPSSGPTYVVEFGDYVTSPDPPYPGATVSKTFTPYSPAWLEVAVDPNDGTHAQSSVVRVERHEGTWWIRPTAGAAVQPVMFYESTARSSATVRGGAYAGTTFYTLDFYYVRGNATENNVTPMDAYAAELPFVEIDADGAYEVSWDLAFQAEYAVNTEGTYTTTGPSTGTSHTHDVTVWEGKYQFPEVVCVLQYRVGGSGSWTDVPQSMQEQLVIAPSSNTFVNSENLSYQHVRRILNLTSGWQIRFNISFNSLASLNDHYLGTIKCRGLMLRYCGEQMSDTAIT